MKYKLKIDFFYNKQHTKGSLFELAGTDYYEDKTKYSLVSKDLVENNPDIFEPIPEPIEMEGEIIALEHNGENDKRILIQTEQNLIDTMIGRTVKLIIK